MLDYKAKQIGISTPNGATRSHAAPQSQIFSRISNNMVGAAVMGIVMMGFMSMQNYQQKGIINNQTVMSRNMLQLRIERYLSDSNALSKTLAVNSALNDCLKSPPNCTAASNQGFSLRDSNDAEIAGAGSASPKRYDIDGAPCTTASSRCIFEVFTAYTATCSGASPCSSPSVTTKYTIQQAAGQTSAGGTPLKKIESPAIPLTVSGTGGSSLPTPPTCPSPGSLYWTGSAWGCNSATATDCQYTWNSCGSGGGGGSTSFLKTISITQYPANGGAACPTSPASCGYKCTCPVAPNQYGATSSPWYFTDDKSGKVCGNDGGAYHFLWSCTPQ